MFGSFDDAMKIIQELQQSYPVQSASYRVCAVILKKLQAAWDVEEARSAEETRRIMEQVDCVPF